MVDTMCEALDYIVPAIVVLAIDLRGPIMCSECTMALHTDNKIHTARAANFQGSAFSWVTIREIFS